MNEYKDIEFFGIIKKSPALHFYLMQLVTFCYMGYRFASRDYTIYGYFTSDMFEYPRRKFIELWPTPWLEFTTFQFIYDFIPYPTVETLSWMQYLVIILCFMGVIGVFARYCAIITFLIGIHITGLMQSSNAEIDGGTLVLVSLLVLALSPYDSFYSIFKKSSWNIRQSRVDYHWPVFLLFLLVGLFYFFSGLNKLIDVGPHWFMVLDLEKMAQVSIENSVFISSRYVIPQFSVWMISPYLSDFLGVLTLIGELGLISILFLPKYRFFFISILIGLHFSVFFMAGINFIGSSLILLLCLNYNNTLSKINLFVAGPNNVILSCLKKIDFFDSIKIIRPKSNDFTSSNITEGKIIVSLVDKPEKQLSGISAVVELLNRIPLMFPIAALFKIPFVICLADYLAGNCKINNLKS